MSSSYPLFCFRTCGLIIYFLYVYYAVAITIDPPARTGTTLSSVPLMVRGEPSVLPIVHPVHINLKASVLSPPRGGIP